LNKKELFAAAEKTANWMIANQPTDRLDANKGRTINCYDKYTGYFTYTTSWQTGGACMGLLAMYKRTGKQIYLDRAELAGRYIMSLQIMDQREERYYGAIRECTPQSLEFCPRDATTAAWALVWLYEATNNPEYLDRAVLFGNWHMNYGMYNGWPLHGIIMDGKFTDRYARGPFQSGTGLFYFDLFMQSGNSRYIDFGMRPIAENYRDYFIREDGSIVIQRDIFSNKDATEKKMEIVEHDIHQYNDDFGCAMLQTAADLFADESYRESACKFTRHLMKNQDEEGGFTNAGGEVHSAVPMAVMYFDELGKFYDDKELLAARDKALKKMLSTQFNDSGDVRLEGGFKGMFEGDSDSDGRHCVNMRTSMYALIALLKLERDTPGIWLGNNNESFVDPLEKLNKNPYKFKW
jgi:hypothetical protein